jgi:hypothetical protein
VTTRIPEAGLVNHMEKPQFAGALHVLVTVLSSVPATVTITQVTNN